MISKYFKDFDKKIVKKRKTPVSTEGKKSGKDTAKAHLDVRMLSEHLSRIVPSSLKVEAVKPIDSAGFSPDGVDLVAYDAYFPDIIDLMGGYIPYELIYGMYHIVQDLNKDSLFEVLTKIATAKKLNIFAANPDDDTTVHIPSFVIAAHTKYSFNELKNDIINFYLSKNIEYQFEIDILMILHKGIVVKNWREKRSFIGLETKEDTNMWFFILMNEYLDIKRDRNIDFRKYVKKEVVYNEY